jgi:hypothetical protein
VSLIASHAAESGHWYDRNGEPAYTIVGANGKARPTTLRDARKLNLVPSVTTIIKVAAQPGLDRWKQEQTLLAALTLPKVDDESDSDYIARILDDSKEASRSAADAGTDIHASIEAFYRGEVRNRHQEHVQGFVTALQEHCGQHAWVAERSFSHESGFGGKIDLHAPGFVVDVKTKEFTDPAKVQGYDEHLMQLAAYRVGLGMPQARGINAFVSRSVPGLCVLREWTQAELDTGWKMFHALLTFWQLKNDHR